jgi:DNA-binding transcriptional MocR family regulator
MWEDLKLTEDGQPIYRQLAAAIAERIARGDIAIGDKLPPQRELARTLGINPTTVTRAFSSLQRSGLVESRPGRGTLVINAEVGERFSNAAFQSAPSEESGLIDLTVNRPATPAYLDALAALLPRLSRDRRYASVQDYHPPEGPSWARAAAAQWLAPIAGGGDPACFVLTDGAQQGLACVLSAIAKPGDIILSDVVTYQGLSALCRALSLDLRGIAMDRNGMRPDALDETCREARPRAIVLVPTFHNPTTITLSQDRREALVAVARQHNTLIIEDDVYGPLADERPPSIATLEPGLTIHVSGLSKCAAPGLRLAFVAAPRALVADIAMALRINCWCVSPLTCLVGALLIEDGALSDIIARQKAELRLRQDIVADRLRDWDVQAADTCTHAWLTLPEPWRVAAFVRAVHRGGVGVLPSDAFTVGRGAAPHAVRINVGAARSRNDLAKALGVISAVLRSRHQHLPDMI